MATQTYQIRNGNVVINKANGRPVMIDKLAKARQDVARLLALDRPWGAGLDRHIGTVPESAYSLSAAVQQDIRQAMDALQQVQSQYQRGQRDLEEMIAYIARMYVWPARFKAEGEASKTAYVLRLDVVTIAGATIKTSNTLITPQGA